MTTASVQELEGLARRYEALAEKLRTIQLPVNIVLHERLHDLFVMYSGIFTPFLNGSLNISPAMRAREVGDRRGFLDRFGEFEAAVITLHEE